MLELLSLFGTQLVVGAAAPVVLAEALTSLGKGQDTKMDVFSKDGEPACPATPNPTKGLVHIDQLGQAGAMWPSPHKWGLSDSPVWGSSNDPWGVSPGQWGSGDWIGDSLQSSNWDLAGWRQLDARIGWEGLLSDKGLNGAGISSPPTP